jgi:hypothetical protein
VRSTAAPPHVLLGAQPTHRQAYNIEPNSLVKIVKTVQTTSKLPADKSDLKK